MKSLGSKGFAVVGAFASLQFGPGSNPGVEAICWLSLLLVLSLFREVSLRFSRFPLSSKTNTSKIQFDLKRMDTFKRVHKNS